MARRHELSDEQWNVIKDLIPGKKRDPGRTGRNDRLFINAVLFVLKTGIPWDDLPGRYGKPNSVWKRYDRWCAQGVWGRIFLAIGESELTDEFAGRFDLNPSRSILPSSKLTGSHPPAAA